MTTWRVALSLDVLLAQVNRAAPNRSTVSDGSIGDPSHSSRESDHNPNPAGVVRARDITHDPAHGCDAGLLAEQIRRLGLEGHPALGPGAYVIWNRRIASSTPDGAPWDWEPYSGSNPHDHHVHVSVATDREGYDSVAPWQIGEDEDMNDAQDQRLKRIEAQVTETHNVMVRKLERANGRIARANERLQKLRLQGAATRAEIEDQLDALSDDLADLEDDTP
jgi:hypothetical protein